VTLWRSASLATRLALMAAAGVAAAVAAFGVAGYLLIKDGAFDNLDRSLAVTADAVAIEAEGGDLGVRDFEAPPTARSVVRPRTTTPDAPVATFVQLLEAGRPLGPARVAGTASVAPPLPALPVGPPRTATIRGERFRVLVRAISPSSDGRPRSVAVARPVADVEATLDEAAVRLAVGGAAASLLALAVALLATRRGLRRLVRVQAAAERVAASEDLSVRIPQGRPDEVGRLAAAVNRMLARLETAQSRLSGALEEQRRFAADASHELRTPLTALRGDIDLLRRHPLPDGEREEVLAEMATAVDRMGRLVEGLLALARAEAAGGPRRRVVDIGELLAELARPGECPAPPAARPLPVAGDPDALHGLFRNLLENARRHGRRVQVSARAEGDAAVVEVSDDGPGVAPADRERIFDRFYRAPELRSTPGSGLGLAIARMAAERTGGSVRLLDSEVGARFEVRLPLAAGATAGAAGAAAPAAPC
jgi:signal transduction histidine kinase